MKRWIVDFCTGRNKLYRWDDAEVACDRLMKLVTDVLNDESKVLDVGLSARMDVCMHVCVYVYACPSSGMHVCMSLCSCLNACSHVTVHSVIGYCVSRCWGRRCRGNRTHSQLWLPRWQNARSNSQIWCDVFRLIFVRDCFMNTCERDLF